MMALTNLTAAEIAERVRRREISAVEVLDATLRQIEAVDGALATPRGADVDDGGVHAYIAPLLADEARAQAEALDERAARGETLPPLAGVPVAVKDVFCVKGALTTAASYILHNYRAAYDAAAVARLRAAGALIIGKVNLDEFALGSSTESSAYAPRTRNPYATTRVPGGSSGGSAAAVASRTAALALGSDTAGSIRQPAAFCGVVGLKPTYGRVSRWGLLALSSSLDCVGPIGRTVRDCALALSAVAGHDPRDWTSAVLPVPDYAALLHDDAARAAVQGKRIGIPREYLDETFMPAAESAAIRRAFDETADVYRSLGAQVVEISLPHTSFGIPAYFIISRLELASNLHRYDGVKYGYRAEGDLPTLQALYEQTRTQGFGAQPSQRILMGMHVSSLGFESDDDRENLYLRALKVRRLIRQDFETAFGSVDLILAPTTPTTAFPANRDAQIDTVAMQNADRLVVNANHAGLPAISFPCGADESGLPIGVQLIAPDFREDSLLQAAHAYQTVTTWHTRTPQFVI